jgi:hypothetical protein
MKMRTIISSVLAVIILGGVGAGSYLLGKKTDDPKVASSTGTPSTPDTSSKPTDTKTDSNTALPTADPSGQTASINKYAPEGLLNASYTRKLTDFTAWQESPVTVIYRDFNQDNVTDAFVYAKIPGTMGYSFAAVWTLKDGAPKELWFLPADQYVAQSSWAVNSINTLVNAGKTDDGGTVKDKTNNWHWQVTTTGSGFVLEPNI